MREYLLLVLAAETVGMFNIRKKRMASENMTNWKNDSKEELLLKLLAAASICSFLILDFFVCFTYWVAVI